MIKYVLECSDRSVIGLTVKKGDARAVDSHCVPMTIKDAQKRLHRSRRQIHRYLTNGTLHAAGNILGMCLLDSGEVGRLAQFIQRLKKAGHPPKTLKPLFPEYSIKMLDPMRHGDIILERVLERGTLKEFRWAMALYDVAAIKEFLARCGARRLSKKSLVFWSWYFGVPLALAAPRQRLARMLGGAA